MPSLLSGIHFGLEEAAIVVMTLSLCLIILNSRGTILNRRARKDVRQTQCAHDEATPRLGGAAIFAAVAMASVFVDGFFGGRYAKFALTMLPMISVTLWEDMLRPTSARTRLLATIASCLLTTLSLSVWLSSLDVPLLDPWLAGAGGIAVTVAMVAASVNGFNMVDGVNGLCAGIALAALLSLHMLGNAVGHVFLAHITLTLAAAVAVFLIFNFPRARIFLGDTGSYVLGYVICWFGILLCFRFPAVSPWAILLILAYPLSELVVTLARRLLAGHSPFRADARHMHHLVRLLLSQTTSHGKPMPWQNPATSLLILPFAIAPMAGAVLFFDSPRVLQGLTFSYGALFAAVYAGLFMLTRKRGHVRVNSDAGYPTVGAPALRVVDAGSGAGQDRAA